jgi:hypothetical protein
MLKVLWLTNGDEINHCLIDDLKCLSSLLYMLENSKQIKQIKIEKFGYTVQDLYREFGYGTIEKFVTCFTYN